jgi:Amt family ammonium transporter
MLIMSGLHHKQYERQFFCTQFSHFSFSYNLSACPKASLVFLMQAGFAMVCAGCVQKKNIQNSMLKNLLDACGAAVGFYCFGYAFAFGGSTASGSPTTFIGNTNFFLMGIEDNFLYKGTIQANSFWLFQFAFAATAATIVAGTLAERCQMSAYLCYSFLLTSFIYPVAVHAVWSPNGFLSPLNANPLFGVGMIDFSGSGVVHTTGGITALIATHILGARRGRFHDLRGNKLAVPKKFVGHSASLQVLGTFILWFGWYGFNPGSVLFVSVPSMANAAARAAVTTTLSAAAGAVTALATNLIGTERLYGEAVYDLGYALNGALGGLVAITAGCTVVETWASLVIGGIGGLLFSACSIVLEKLCLDDAVDAIPVHLANGVWGCISVGLFATPAFMEEVYGTSDNVGWFYEWTRGSANGRLLAAQLVGLAFIMAWVTAIMYPFFSFIDFMGWFRADSLEELVGLDISYHGGDNPEDTANTEFAEAMKVKKSMGKKGFFRRRKARELQDFEVDAYASGAGAGEGDGQVTEQYHPQSSNYDVDQNA